MNARRLLRHSKPENDHLHSTSSGGSGTANATAPDGTLQEVLRGFDSLERFRDGEITTETADTLYKLQTQALAVTTQIYVDDRSCLCTLRRVWKRAVTAAIALEAVDSEALLQVQALIHLVDMVQSCTWQVAETGKLADHIVNAVIECVLSIIPVLRSTQQSSEAHKQLLDEETLASVLRWGCNLDLKAAYLSICSQFGSTAAALAAHPTIITSVLTTLMSQYSAPNNLWCFPIADAKVASRLLDITTALVRRAADETQSGGSTSPTKTTSDLQRWLSVLQHTRAAWATPHPSADEHCDQVASRLVELQLIAHSLLPTGTAIRLARTLCHSFLWSLWGPSLLAALRRYLCDQLESSRPSIPTALDGAMTSVGVFDRVSSLGATRVAACILLLAAAAQAPVDECEDQGVQAAPLASLRAFGALLASAEAGCTAGSTSTLRLLRTLPELGTLTLLSAFAWTRDTTGEVAGDVAAAGPGGSAERQSGGVEGPAREGGCTAQKMYGAVSTNVGPRERASIQTLLVNASIAWSAKHVPVVLNGRQREGGVALAALMSDVFETCDSLEHAGGDTAAPMDVDEADGGLVSGAADTVHQVADLLSGSAASPLFEQYRLLEGTRLVAWTSGLLMLLGKSTTTNLVARLHHKLPGKAFTPLLTAAALGSEEELVMAERELLYLAAQQNPDCS